MAVNQRDLEIRFERGRNGSSAPRDEPPIGDLFRRLSDDASRLVRQEIALAKVELRESVSVLGKSAVKVGIAAGVALLGALAAVAFLIVGLGDLIDNYWLSALIVSAVLLAIAAVMGKGAMNDLKGHEMKPAQTIDTLRDDADWAKQEIATVKREWRS
jgi:uncharacterized membrane protein YqjE